MQIYRAIYRYLMGLSGGLKAENEKPKLKIQKF